MTDRLWFLVSWLVAGAIALGLGLGSAIGVLAPSLALDLIAAWPIPALALILTVVVWKLRSSRPWLMAVPGLVVISWLILIVAAHLSAVPWLPSAAADVMAPIGTEAAAIEVAVERGEIRVGSDSALTGYQIIAQRRSGALGPPSVLEQTLDGISRLVVVARGGGVWYETSGWNVTLSEDHVWDLDLVAPRVVADVGSLSVRRMSVRAARGSLVLAGHDQAAALDVTGTITIDLQPGILVRVVGNVTAPEDWPTSPDGSSTNAPSDSPVDWEVTVRSGSAVVIRQT